MPSFLSPLIRDGVSGYRLLNERTGSVVAETLLVAFDSSSRRTGLLKHTDLPADQALIIAPCNSVHTFFMKFTIDVIYVTHDGTVKKVSAAVRPWRMSASPGAFATIECAEGVAGRVDLRQGDRLLVSPKSTQP